MNSDERKEQLTRGLSVLQYVRNHVHEELPMQQLHILYALALNGGEMHMSELRRTLGMTGSSLSRNTQNLSDWSWLKKPGLGLVSIDTDPRDIRAKVVRLNKAGEALMDSLARYHSGEDEVKASAGPATPGAATRRPRSSAEKV